MALAIISLLDLSPLSLGQISIVVLLMMLRLRQLLIVIRNPRVHCTLLAFALYLTIAMIPCTATLVVAGVGIVLCRPPTGLTEPRRDEPCELGLWG